MLTFPPSPKEGETFTQGGVTYTFNLTENTWYISSNGGEGDESLWAAGVVKTTPPPCTIDPYWNNPKSREEEEAV